VKLRPHHLVGLILLLTALRGAEGAVLPAGEYTIDSRYGLVLSQDRSGVWTEVKLSDHKPGWRIGSGSFFLPTRLSARTDATLNTDLPASSRAAFRTPWTMRPPAAQCAALHSATGFGIASNPSPAL
jgi:hypothetical protein